MSINAVRLQLLLPLLQKGDAAHRLCFSQMQSGSNVTAETRDIEGEILPQFVFRDICCLSFGGDKRYFIKTDNRVTTLETSSFMFYVSYQLYKRPIKDQIPPIYGVEFAVFLMLATA